MANKRISQLPLTSTPGLTGLSVVVDNGTTFKTTLSTLRETLVDSGSHNFTGNQTIYGNLYIIDGFVSASNLNSPLSLSGTTIYSNNPATSNFGTNHNILIGTDSGGDATGILHSVFLGQQAGYGAIDAGWSNFLGRVAGYGATDAYDSNFFGDSAGFQATHANDSNFFGWLAGHDAHSASFSNFFGNYAGGGAYDSEKSNFFGLEAGTGSLSSKWSNFFGFQAGAYSINTSGSNFMGSETGLQTRAGYSNFIGHRAGYFAYSSSYSNFIGHYAGASAANALNSNFIGREVGIHAYSASFSTLIGYNVGVGSGSYPNTSIGRNNIIIGTNISLEYGRKDSINIGGIIFGTGSYFQTGSHITNGTLPFSGSANGRIGINQPNPQYELDISGSGGYSSDLTVGRSLHIGGVSERVQIDGGFSGNKDFNYDSGSIFYITGLTGNGTWNVNSVPTTDNKSITLTFLVIQDSTPYSGSQYQINGSNISIKWVDSTVPTGSANKTDVIGLSAFRINSTWDVYGSLVTLG